MFRTITLSLLMLVSVIVMLPFASSTAHGLGQSSISQQQRRYRRHSRAWWRRHRARMRLRRAAAMAHRSAPLNPVMPNMVTNMASVEKPSAGLPMLPVGWNSTATANGAELKFRTEAAAAIPGQGTLTVVARSRPNPSYLTQREQRTMLSGVSFSDLRRIAIDKMINAGGWVINDYERQVNGARVFVVIAQTPSDGRSPEKAWNFYFAEVDGKIYSLTLNTPVEFSNRLPAEGEKFMSSLAAKNNAAATTK